MTIATAVVGRGERFAARSGGTPLPQFADELRQRRWTRAAQLCGPNWPIVIGILTSRPAIDEELSGAALAELASAIGEPLFDAICDADITDIAVVRDAPTPSLAVAAIRGEQALAKRGALNEALLDRAAEIVERTI